MSLDKKSPLLFKICEPATSHKKYPLPEPFPNRPSNPTPIPLTYHCLTLSTTPLFPPLWNSPTNGERKFWGIKEEKDEKNVLEKLVFGEYNSLSETCRENFVQANEQTFKGRS